MFSKTSFYEHFIVHNRLLVLWQLRVCVYAYACMCVVHKCVCVKHHGFFQVAGVLQIHMSTFQHWNSKLYVGWILEVFTYNFYANETEHFPFISAHMKCLFHVISNLHLIGGYYLCYLFEHCPFLCKTDGMLVKHFSL